MERVKKAVESGKVESVTMTASTQRRLVLEAIAFGTFLRDVEAYVEGEFALLTPKSSASGPDGGGGGGGSMAGVG